MVRCLLPKSTKNVAQVSQAPMLGQDTPPPVLLCLHSFGFLGTGARQARSVGSGQWLPSGVFDSLIL